MFGACAGCGFKGDKREISSCLLEYFQVYLTEVSLETDMRIHYGYGSVPPTILVRLCVRVCVTHPFTALIHVSIQPPLQASPPLDSGASLIIDTGAHPYQWAQELAGLGDGVEEGPKKEQNVPVGPARSGEVLQLLLKQAKAVGKADSAGLQKAA